ncbi:MAG: imidazole glycerol phosphate synthase subunit HisF [Phycisphaerales bacterium]
MLKRRIIPCLDVRDGRTVKGVQFKGLVDAGDPVDLAARYAADGADELCVLDVSATLEARRTTLDVVARIRAVIDIPLTVGGGVRKTVDAARLLEAGADKVAVNSAALDDPSLLVRLADRFGRQCVVLSVDAARAGPRVGDGWIVVTHAGTRRRGVDAIAWCRAGTRTVPRAGAGEILLTSVDRDGVGRGYDLDLLAAVAQVTDVPIIASGGGGSAADMQAAFAVGASAALAAGMFHRQESTIPGVRRALAAHGVPVREPVETPPGAPIHPPVDRPTQVASAASAATAASSTVSTSAGSGPTSTRRAIPSRPDSESIQ